MTADDVEMARLSAVREAQRDSAQPQKK